RQIARRTLGGDGHRGFSAAVFRASRRRHPRRAGGRLRPVAAARSRPRPLCDGRIETALCRALPAYRDARLFEPRRRDHARDSRRDARRRACRWRALRRASRSREAGRLSFVVCAHLDQPAPALSHRPLRCRRAVLHPPGESGRPQPIVQLARRAQRDAAAPAGALRSALRPVWRSRFGEEDATDESSYKLPVWGVRGSKFTSHYSRTFIEVAQRRPEVPRLSAAQAEAIELLHDIAEELSFEMSFRPGAIQFVNNHVIYHARRGFEDDPADGGRLLLRLWMAMPNSRALPEDHR